MHLKSLTVRGFKSFASATTFEFEPGVTAVVGPNGSGKSNVVDALAWVMGEQGAKTLRGGKMEDVIFAGTSGRPPLGRAHVSLTIDNSDGALPDRVQRSHDLPHPVPHRRLGIRHQRRRLPAAGHPGTALRLRPGPGDARDRGPGPAGQGPARHPGGPARLHRRSRRHPQAPPPQGKDGPQARSHAGQPAAAQRPHRRNPAAADARWASRRKWPGAPRRVQFEVRDARSRLLADDLVQLQSALAQDVADEAALKARRGRRRAGTRSRPAAAGRPRTARRRGHPQAQRRPGHLVPALRRAGTAAVPRLARRGTPPAARRRRRRPGLRPRPGPAGPAGRPASATNRPGWNARSWTGAAPWTPRQPPSRTPKTPPPPRTSGSRPCSGPPRTAAKAWPSSPARSAPRGPGWSRRRRNSAGSANPSRPGRSAAGRPRASSPPWNPRWPASRTARNPSTPTTRTPAPPSTPSSPRSTRSKAAEREGERERGALMARRDALQLGLNRKDGSGHVLGAGTARGPRIPGVHDHGGSRVSRPPSPPPSAPPPTPSWSRTAEPPPPRSSG